jgi:hypothetical protein
MDKPVRLLSLLIVFPALAVAQTPQPIPAQPSMFEVLSDSQWIRVSSTGHARREARLLEHSATEIVLDLEPRPLRIPVIGIDTLWERRTASKTGALVGGLPAGSHQRKCEGRRADEYVSAGLVDELTMAPGVFEPNRGKLPGSSSGRTRAPDHKGILISRSP